MRRAHAHKGKRLEESVRRWEGWEEDIRGDKIRIDRIIWLEEIIEKIRNKHSVTVTEVEEVFKNKPKFRRGPRGNYIKENIYYALGSTEANRLLFIVFIFKRTNEALIISAREMDIKEKSMYSKL